MTITTTTNQFTISGALPSTQYWYRIMGVGAQFIIGTFTTDGSGNWIEIINTNPSVFDWASFVEVFTDANYSILDTTSQSQIIIDDTSICPPFVLRKGCSVVDPNLLDELRCQIRNMVAFHAQLGNSGAVGDCSYCVKPFTPVEVTKECVDCETGQPFTQVDICATRNANLNLFLASVSV